VRDGEGHVREARGGHGAGAAAPACGSPKAGEEASGDRRDEAEEYRGRGYGKEDEYGAGCGDGEEDELEFGESESGDEIKAFELDSGMFCFYADEAVLFMWCLCYYWSWLLVWFLCVLIILRTVAISYEIPYETAVCGAVERFDSPHWHPVNVDCEKPVGHNFQDTAWGGNNSSRVDGPAARPDYTHFETVYLWRAGAWTQGWCSNE
jgi:hypothetical protein